MEMKIMKKVICVLLALMFCLYMPVTALAATNSAGQSGVAPWYCSVCGKLNTTSNVCNQTVGCTGMAHNTPQTGDTSMINMWFVVMIIALVALVVAVVFFRRSKKA